MTRRFAARLAAALVGLGAIGFGGWILSLPSRPAGGVAPPIAKAEADATVAALKPPKRPRPLIAIVGANEGTETTDYLMPYGILRRADVADVMALGTEPGPVTLYPAFRVEPDATVAEFDEKFPEGADYVVVPAMKRDDDPVVLRWIQSQAGKGALIVGVCVGATIVANAGLLDGKRATTHWYSLDDMLDDHPTIRHVPDRRLVVDGGVVTTTGISASMPVSLTLIEAIAGRARADEVARDLGLPDWDASHVSGAYALTRSFALTAMRNKLAFWNRDTFGIELTPGLDEVSLALVADAWSRTYRSRAVTFAAAPRAVPTRHGARILPDEITSALPPERRLEVGPHKPAEALDRSLSDIEARYGGATADLVTMQLEVPRERRASTP